MQELERTWAFEVVLQDRCAERREPFEWGTALFRLDIPRVHDQNLLRVERGFDTVSARELAGEADRLQRPAGLSHRKLLLPDEDAGERLSGEFAELSWRRARHVTMAHRGSAPAAPVHAVRELDPVKLRPARTRAFEQDLGGIAAAQVAAALDVVAAAADSSRGFAVEVDGEVVSWCVLYEGDGIGQIDDVVTAEEHRRRGYGRAVVAAATRASREARNDITFLVADDEDWPKEMYARLGYEAIGRRFEFTRT
ncbi:MAG TPA: GNAT family N-acetyltransferase [Thermoleophilaceae bacterium]|jgi:ribosomal protein S18 acetylase RimI-like enzyme